MDRSHLRTKRADMMTRDFAQRTRERIAETRALLTKLRETSKEVVRQLAKVDKQHAADRTRIYDKLGELAEDVFGKLPEEASDADADRAGELQDQINDLAGDVEGISLASTAIEDLGSVLDETIREAYASLKQADVETSKMERVGTKLGI